LQIVSAESHFLVFILTLQPQPPQHLFSAAIADLKVVVVRKEMAEGLQLMTIFDNSEIAN